MPEPRKDLVSSKSTCRETPISLLEDERPYGEPRYLRQVLSDNQSPGKDMCGLGSSRWTAQLSPSSIADLQNYEQIKWQLSDTTISELCFAPRKKDGLPGDDLTFTHSMLPDVVHMQNFQGNIVSYRLYNTQRGAKSVHNSV